METTNTLQNINSQLAKLIENDEYTSIGYVPILNSITAADIITIKKAQKLLDSVVIQNISNENFDAFTVQALQKLAPNLVIDKIEEDFPNIHISFETHQLNSLNLMRGVLAILPSSVFINQDNFAIFKAVTTLENTFKELFSLHNISSPDSIKSFIELDIISELQSLEKSGLEISKGSILEYLGQHQIADYQELLHNGKLFINLKITDRKTAGLLNISYCFNRI